MAQTVLRVLIVQIFLLGAVAAAASPDKALTIDLAEVHPTQMQVGLATVRDMVQTLYIDKAIGTDHELAAFASRSGPAKALSQLSPEQRGNLRAKLAQFLEHNTSPEVRAIKGPTGLIYITDGHHRITALELLTLEGNPPLLDPAKARVRVSIASDLDFTGRPKEFTKYLASTGFYTREVRESHARKEITDHQILERLPRSMLDMARADNPTRSTIGKIFSQMGIDAENFAAHVEFLIGEKVSCEIGSLPGYEYDDLTLERARRAVFGNSELVAFLRSQELPGIHKAAAEAQLRRALTSFKTLEKERIARKMPEPEPNHCRPVVTRGKP